MSSSSTSPESSFFGLAGKRALVAGGGQGIGRSCASMLSRAGCRVAVVDRERERAEAVVAEHGNDSGVAIDEDVLSAAGGERCIARTIEALGGLDVCVNIIGLASWKPFLEMDEETWDGDMLGNLKHHVFIARPAALQMVAQGTGGAIAMVASASGLFAAPNHSAYGAAKAGVVSLAQSMAEELAPHDIRVNAVAPGSVRTPRIVAMQARGDAPKQQGGLDRMAECDDIGNAVLFLCSDLARKVTGHTLVVDAGATTKFPFDIG